jgi:hypothetical protein
MTTVAIETPIPRSESRVYYGWIVLGVAALAVAVAILAAAAALARMPER